MEDASSGLDATSEAMAPVDASMEAAQDAPDDGDAGNACFVNSVGTFGQCMTTTACAALGDHTSTPGYCPGPAGIECCTDTPDVSDNPPVPTGWTLMQQSQVTSAMTTWAVNILHDPTTYPMFSTTTQTFGSQLVMARVEWHPPDFQNSAVHRGVTLYVPV
jgi:hypothetical protein